jgi:hypothetical protein
VHELSCYSLTQEGIRYMTFFNSVEPRIHFLFLYYIISRVVGSLENNLLALGISCMYFEEDSKAVITLIKLFFCLQVFCFLFISIVIRWYCISSVLYIYLCPLSLIHHFQALVWYWIRISGNMAWDCFYLRISWDACEDDGNISCYWWRQWQWWW